MGPSGSGKTTLLNLLGGRNLELTEGEVKLNGVPWKKSFKKLVGFVKQEDIFYQHLTVREQLEFSALLRMPVSLPRKRKLQEVGRVIAILAMESCENTTIALISGGEKKRANIGTELLSDPSVLLLDEPTSGLDSTSAYSLVVTLRKLAALGKTVISSIHQPSSQVYRMFDKVMLLCDGKQVFSGRGDAVMPYLSTKGFSCDMSFNPADFMLDVMSAQPTQDWFNPNNTTHLKYSSKEGQLPKHCLMDEWDNDAEGARVGQMVQAMGRVGGAATGSEAPGGKDPLALASPKEFEERLGQARLGWLEQFRILYLRSTKNTRADLFTFLNIFQSVAMAFICGVLFFGLDSSESSIDKNSGLLFFTTSFWVFNSMFNALMAFPAERVVIKKERESGSYNLSAFFLAKSFSEAPVRLTMPLMFVTIAYWFAGLNPAPGAFFGMVLTNMLGVLAGESLGLLFGAAIVDAEKAVVASTLYLLTMLLVGGFFISDVPEWLAWLEYLSPFRYTYQGTLLFQFDTNSSGAECDGSGVLAYCFETGIGGVAPPSVVLEYLNQTGSVALNLGVLALMFVTVRIAAYYCLR
ncbi:unnamed protein product [Chrysoparadoxa australica]